MAVLFAVLAVGIVAMVGLAFDAGRAYVDQRALQAAADTAADGGARILSQDYQACMQGQPLPNDPTAIGSTIAALVKGGTAGPGLATSYTADFTDGSGTIIGPVAGASDSTWCSDWQSLTSDACGSGGSVPPPGTVQGVAVTAVDLHPTELLPVVGISVAQETAKSISVFSFGCGTGENFVAWYQDCTTLTDIGPGSQIVYYSSNHWASAIGGCAAATVSSSGFKGDLKLQGLNPPIVKVPGWINAEEGRGADVGTVTVGEKIWIPMVDLICDNAGAGGGYTPGVPPCVEPARSVALPDAPYCAVPYNLSTTENVYLCAVAQVELTVDNPCSASSGGGANPPCMGTVDKIIWGTPGSTVNLALQGVTVVALLQ